MPLFYGGPRGMKGLRSAGRCYTEAVLLPVIMGLSDSVPMKPSPPPSNAVRNALPAWLPAAGVFALTALLVAGCLHANHRFFYDDAYITLRYAKHLLAGIGPIWNAQGPRVEGFTSPLHLLLVAATGAAGVPLLDAARCVNGLSHAVLVVFVFVYLRRRVGLFGAALAVLLLAASWMFLVWDLGGLDEILYACLSTVGVLVGLRFVDSAEPHRERSLLLGMLLLAFATMARPEGALFLAGLWLVAAVSPRREGKLRTLLVAAAVGIVALLPLVLFRWMYFHQIAPNTMYAKMGGISQAQLLVAGTQYLARFLFTPPFVGLLALVAAAFALLRARFTATDAGLWWFIALNILFILISGGDHMLAYRFCIPMYSLLAVVFVRHLAALDLLAEPGLQPALIGLLFTVLGLQTRVENLNPRYLDAASNVGMHVGLYIRDHWKPGSVVALNTAGATPYFADDMQYIDMLGLNDLEIARRKDIPREGPWIHRIGHLKGDAASVLARHPDYIIVGPADGTTTELRQKAFFFGDYELANSAAFRADYHPCSVPLSDGITFTFYKRVSVGTDCP